MEYGDAEAVREPAYFIDSMVGWNLRLGLLADGKDKDH
jgi:hypothetical protein